jgi:dolichol-phosphate mannosyltransferase
MFSAGIALLVAIVLLVQKLAGAYEGGWAPMVVIVLFLGGVQLVCIGAVGEYIGRIYDEVKQRPLYIIARTSGL